VITASSSANSKIVSFGKVQVASPALDSSSALIASITVGFEYPSPATVQLALKSRYSFPLTSVIMLPWAFLTKSG